MACKCAERMRKYVLPWFDYRLVGDTWVTLSPDAPEDLRRIPDTDVEKHHRLLTTRILLILGSKKYLAWWATTIPTQEAEEEQHD